MATDQSMSDIPSSAGVPVAPRLDVNDPQEKTNPILALRLGLIHVLALGVFFFPPSGGDVLLCICLYYLRMFFITAGFHRYFAHRGYKMGRVMQFVMAFGGGMAMQKGALWWASHHRWHHQFSDTDRDPHSSGRGFLWSHLLWIVCDKFVPTHYETIRDYARYPELVWLDHHHLVPPTILALLVWFWGGLPALFCGFFLSTVLLYHGTFSINSLTHKWGRTRYETGETSKNSFILSLVTLGEGWHNNHHYYASTANQGFFWWELDISYYVLRVLSWIGLTSDLRVPTDRARFQNWKDTAARDRLAHRYGYVVVEKGRRPRSPEVNLGELAPGAIAPEGVPN